MFDFNKAKKLQKIIPSLEVWADCIAVRNLNSNRRKLFKYEDLYSVDKILEMAEFSTNPWKIGNVVIVLHEDRSFTLTRDYLVLNITEQPKHTNKSWHNEKVIELLAFALDRADISLYPKKLNMTFEEAVAHILDGHQASIDANIAFHEKFLNGELR